MSKTRAAVENHNLEAGSVVKVNMGLKLMNCKIVYYGPGLSGKTTNIQVVHGHTPEDHKGELTSIQTKDDRTLFFDYMPLDVGSVAGLKTKLHLYTVPGQVYYNETRRLVLKNADAIVFVADSDPTRHDDNIESYENLIENLEEFNVELVDLPHVIQFNKRDLENAMSVEKMDKTLNRFGVPTFESVATDGTGVFPTLKILTGMLMGSLAIEKRSSEKPNAKKRRWYESDEMTRKPAKTAKKAKKKSTKKKAKKSPRKSTKKRKAKVHK